MLVTFRTIAHADITMLGDVAVELVKLAQRAGSQFREVSVHHYAREFGQSQFFRAGRIARTYLDIARMWLKLMVFGAVRR